MLDPSPQDGAPYCVICLVLLGGRACAAVTTIAGDAICVDHVQVRVDYISLQAAIRVARADLNMPDRPDPHPALALAHIDPLSEREHDVLRFLASQLGGPEIAAELHISPNTLKTHQQAIYRKLGVSQRHDAVHRAKQLGLLP